jgi:hypothetical protein
MSQAHDEWKAQYHQSTVESRVATDKAWEQLSAEIAQRHKPLLMRLQIALQYGRAQGDSEMSFIDRQAKRADEWRELAVQFQDLLRLYREADEATPRN